MPPGGGCGGKISLLLSEELELLELELEDLESPGGSPSTPPEIGYALEEQGVLGLVPNYRAQLKGFPRLFHNVGFAG
jgi:hypothetical protein